MKKTLALLAAFVAGPLMAAEHPGNPDRFPSFGLTYAGSAESGDARVFGGGVSAVQDVDTANGVFLLDSRIPVSDNVTLSGSLGFTGTTVKAPETNLLAGQDVDTGGMSFSIGVRVYLK